MSRRSAALRAVLLIGGLAPCCTGCLHALAKDLPRTAMPAVIESSLETLDKPANRKRALSIVDSPETKTAIRELVGGVVDSSVHVAATSVRRELTAPGTERDVARVVAAVTRAGMNGLSEAEVSAAIASALTDQLGPALNKVSREDLTPALNEMMQNPALAESFGYAARSLGREIVLGVNDGLRLTKDGMPEEQPSVISRFTSLAGKSASAVGALTWVFAALAGVLAMWVVKLALQARRYHKESEARAKLNPCGEDQSSQAPMNAPAPSPASSPPARPRRPWRRPRRRPVAVAY